jgi:hypothetical protein
MWQGVLLMPDNDSVPNEVLEMSNQHSLGDSGMLRRNSLVRKGPSESLQRIVPFQRPSTTDSMASIGQADISFFDTGIFVLPWY